MKDDLLVRLGERIRTLRKVQGLTQEDLAERAGLHSTYIGQIERAERNVSVGALARVASALQVSLHEVLPTLEGTSSARTQLAPEITAGLQQLDVKTLGLASLIIKSIAEWDRTRRTR